MCQRCKEKRLKDLDEQRKAENRVKLKRNAYGLLRVDLMLGSEYVNFIELINSSDEENHVVAEYILKTKYDECKSKGYMPAEGDIEISAELIKK